MKPSSVLPKPDTSSVVWENHGFSLPFISFLLYVFTGTVLSAIPWKPKVLSPHGELQTGCEECHSSAYWSPVKKDLVFDHGKSGFALTGGHLSTSCDECHDDLAFARVSSACADCHDDVHQGKFGKECDICHTSVRWQSALPTTEFTAHDEFPLLGYHANIECGRCHRGASVDQYQKLSTACNSCHMDDYLAAARPNHQQSGFHAECEACHFSPVSEGWSQGRFAHPASFPLEGKHRSISCQACHADAMPALTTDCFGCHQEDYSNAKPDHTIFEPSRSCERCHDTETWRGAGINSGSDFSHPSSFPLNKGHKGVGCTECHQNEYINTPTDCYQCHQKDFDGAKPSHNGWSRQCLDCHKRSDWKSAEIDHEKFFPIRSGDHKLDCKQCHVYPGDYKRFECINCHEHNKSEMDHEHHGETGNYKYKSSACLDCHPRGRE